MLIKVFASLLQTGTWLTYTLFRKKHVPSNLFVENEEFQSCGSLVIAVFFLIEMII